MVKVSHSRYQLSILKRRLTEYKKELELEK